MDQVRLNKPIFKKNHHHVFTSSEDFYTYINENPEHEVIPRYYVRSGFFATQHIYKDGLLLNIVWELTDIDFKKVHEETNGIKSLANIIYLRNKKWVRLVHGSVWEYSRLSGIESPPTESLAYQRHSLEYQVPYPSKIPDFIFDILISDIENHIKFQEYIEKQESE